MFSTNARRVMCVVAGLILTSLAWIGCANYFNWYADTIGPVAWFGTLFLFAAAGVGAGLLFEKSTRAHYQSAMTANPQLKERMETTLGRRLKFGYVLAGLYVAYRLFGYYLFFVLGFSLSPAAHLQLILSAVVEAVVALVCLLLYWERGEDASTANIKKHLLVYVIFFFVLAVVDGVALLVLKPASAVVQTPATLESALEAFSAEEFSGAAAKGAQALQVKDMVGIASALQKINAHFNQSLTSADLYDMRYTINWGLNEAIAYYQFEADDQSIYALQLTENLATSNIAESYYSFPAGSTSALTGQRISSWQTDSNAAETLFLDTAGAYLNLPMQSPIMNEDLYYPLTASAPSWTVSVLFTSTTEEGQQQVTLYNTFDANTERVTTSTYVPSGNYLPLSPQSPSVSMNVAPPPSNSSLKIISPANGQKLKQGSTYTISWQSSGDFNFVVGNIVAPVPGEGGVGIFQAPATSSRYSWTVPTGFPPGMYKLGLAGSDQDFVNHNFASSSVSIYIIP